MADVTRTQFDPLKSVTKKIAQKGRHGVDADVNEQATVCEHRSSRILNELINGMDTRFKTGWNITGGGNQTTVSAGYAAVELESGQSFLVYLGANTQQSWTNPSADRVDYLYLDVELKEITPTEDPTLINPDVGVETALDTRVVIREGAAGTTGAYRVYKSEGAAVPAPPAGHYYVKLAKIFRYDGQGVIGQDDIINYLSPWRPMQERVIYNDCFEAPYGQNFQEIEDWDDETSVIGLTDDTAATWYKKLRIPLFKDESFNTVIFRAQMRRRSLPPSSATYSLRLTVNGYDPVVWTMSDDAWTLYEIKVRVDEAASGADLNCLFEMQSQTDGAPLARKIQLVTIAEDPS